MTVASSAEAKNLLRGVEVAQREVGVFAISVAARMASMEIQNLRVYERRGLVEPDRTAGGTRLYNHEDVARLVRIGELLADGLNLAGVARVLELERQVHRLRADNRRLRSPVVDPGQPSCGSRRTAFGSAGRKPCSSPHSTACERVLTPMRR